MKRGQWLCIDCGSFSGWSRRCPEHRKARDLELERAWERSPRARSRARKYNATPRWKIYLANWKERHQELQAEYDRRAEERARLRRGLHKFPCETAACKGTFSKWGKAGRRKFCDECRIFYGYAKPLRRKAA
jgi:hypothetical protein